MDLLRYELNHEWMDELCILANVRVRIVRDAAAKIFSGELKMFKGNTMREVRIKTNIRKSKTRTLP